MLQYKQMHFIEHTPTEQDKYATETARIYTTNIAINR